eukprot:364133-Chlamydomonas_euryale.AAC.8
MPVIRRPPVSTFEPSAAGCRPAACRRLPMPGAFRPPAHAGDSTQVGVVGADERLQLVVREAAGLRYSVEKGWDDVEAVQHGPRAHAAPAPQRRQQVFQGLPCSRKAPMQVEVLRRVLCCCAARCRPVNAHPSGGAIVWSWACQTTAPQCRWEVFRTLRPGGDKTEYRERWSDTPCTPGLLLYNDAVDRQQDATVPANCRRLFADILAHPGASWQNSVPAFLLSVLRARAFYTHPGVCTARTRPGIFAPTLAQRSSGPIPLRLGESTFCSGVDPLIGSTLFPSILAYTMHKLGLEINLNMH